MSKARVITRRGFLRFSAAAGAAALIAGCKPTAVETEQPTTEPVDAPTAAVPTTAAPAEVPAKFMFATWGDYRFFEDGFSRMQADLPQYAGVRFENSQADSSTGLVQRLMTDWAAKSWSTMPDVCEMSTSDLPYLAEAGVLTDLTDHLKPFEKDISPAVLEMLKVNGKHYAVPWMPNSAMVWYRKDVFDMAGIDADEIETWDDFIAAGKVVTNFDYPDGVKRYMLSAPATQPDSMQLQLMLGQQGSGLFDPETGECTIDSDPAFKRAFEVWARVVTEGIALRTDEWEAPWFTALEEGTLATFVSANWMDQIIQLDMPKAEGKFRAMKLPAFEPGGCRGAFEGGSANVVAINKPDTNTDLVWAFMEHCFLNAEVAGALTADWKLVPAYIPALEHPYYSSPNEFYGGQVIGDLDKEIQLEAKPFHFTANYSEAMNLITLEMEKAWAGQKSVDQAIADAATAIRNEIGTSF